MKFHPYLTERLEVGGFSTEDTLAAFLPLVRETLEAHLNEQVAPLVGLNDLNVDGNRIWFEVAERRAFRLNASAIHRVQSQNLSHVDIVSEVQRFSSLDDPDEKITNLSLGERGQEITRPVYLTGYVAWEHELEHQDPLTDIFSLGMILASLACGLDFADTDDLERFVASRDNLFRLQPDLHPVLARAIVKMTEVDRHRRAQDLPALLYTLENYRDQEVDFEIDLARIAGLPEKDSKTKQSVVLTKLRERLFDLTRRNRLLHFKANMQSVNLTQASVPLSFDVKNVRSDQILVWNPTTQREFLAGKGVSLNKYLNFAEAIYLPSVLDRIITEARRDEAEYGFAQLRLVVCFLHWANLKDKPIEQYDSPLVLLPVKLSKKKGIRDTYLLEVLETEAEINPVVRHQFKQLYAIDLPDRIDLTQTSLDDFFTLLAKRIESSDVAVELKKIDRPRISLIHERAKRRLDLYRRRARLAGRGVRKFMNLDYSYDPANYHPLGIKLFSEKVRVPQTHLRSIIEEKPRPRSFMVEPTEPAEVVKERSFYSLQEGGEANPYTWTFDLCSVTLANFKYRKMSLVRDYDGLLGEQPVNETFESIFSLAPKSTQRELPEPADLDQRYDVVPCDPTQAAAIEESRTGKSYIIQGPPGTGKSQTITNLIADYVARGKRVLFVCEKRAAIDVVFARLRHCGLKPLCSLIHDSQTDKKDFVMDLKETYERFLTEKHSKTRQIRRTTILRRMREQLTPLERFDEEITQPRQHAGMSVRELLDRCISLREHLPEPTSAAASRMPRYALWHQARPQIDRYESVVRRVQADGIASRHPLSVISPRLTQEEDPVDVVASATEEATIRLEELRAKLGTCGISKEQWDSLAKVAELTAYATRIADLTRAGHTSLLDSKSELSRRFDTQWKSHSKRQKSLADAAVKTTAWKNRLPAAEVEIALEQAKGFEGKFFAWLTPQWWRLRGILNRSYDFSSHVVKPSWRQILESLQLEYARQEEVYASEEEIAKEFNLSGNVTEYATKVEHLRESIKQLPERMTNVHREVLESPQAQDIVDRLVSAATPYSALAEQLSRFMEDEKDFSLEELGQALSDAVDSVEDLPDYLSALAELEAIPRDVSLALRTLPLSPIELEAASAQHSLEEIYREAQGLEQLQGSARAQHAASLKQDYDRWLGSNARDILREVEQRFLASVNLSERPSAKLSAPEKERKKQYTRGRRELEHEFGKSMRFKPIRDLVSGDSGEVVKDLKPVWLMSPLSVSDTLPLDPGFFDVVIFDEASQLTLEEAIPSIFRASQCIVVGDQMQLPPTDFFSSKRNEDEEEELLVEEEGELVQYDLESDSFLNHAAKNLPSTMLGWHYRSRSESLISFSNWKFYDGRLLTVPEQQITDKSRPPILVNEDSDGELAAEALLNRAVSFHYLENAPYENRTNQAEAEYIADLVRQLISQPGGKTIGVVAFSEAQQSEIQEALNRLASADPEFATRLESEYEREDDGQFVGLLVKNLENIQGDERDIIILSVCYGKDARGKMRMNFGPINKSGGEKRLNVAFSRAKHHMALVSSIKYSEITNDYNDGANCLKQYLRYAEAASVSDQGNVSGVLRGLSRWLETSEPPPATSILADAVSAALRERGFIVDQNVGHSHFRCDLAVRHSQDEAYRLGIFLDTPAHYEQADLLERDMMRPRLLRDFGWRVTQVVAMDWYADPQRQLQRLLDLLAGKEDPWLHASTIESSDQEEEDPENEAEEPRESGQDTVEAPPPADEDERQADKITPGDPITVLDRHYLELRDDRSEKFWEITLGENCHMVRFGRIGSRGQTLTKRFSDQETAQGDFERLLREKISKGYQRRE